MRTAIRWRRNRNRNRHDGNGKGSKIRKDSKQSHKLFGNIHTGNRRSSKGNENVWKNAKDGKFFTKQNAIDVAGVAINTFTALCSGKSAYKYGSETVGMMKTTVSDVWSGIKKQATALHNNNGGYLRLGGNTSSNSNVYYHVTTEEYAQKIIETQELKNGEWESYVFAWSKQPTKKQASIAGIGSECQTVIKFETNASFIKDQGNKGKSISDIVVQTTEGERLPISIWNIEIVGFKKEWWKFWKK